MSTVLGDIECGIVDLECRSKRLALQATDGVLRGVADAVGDGLAEMLEYLATFWVRDVGSSRLGVTGSGPGEAAAFVQSSLFPFMAGAAVLAVMVSGARIAWARRAQPARDLLRALLTMVVVSGAGLTTLALGTQAADQFAASVIEASQEGDDLGDNLGFAVLVGRDISTILVLLLGLAALVTSLVQLVLLLVRTGVLVVLAGVLPLSASFTTLSTGRAWFRRVVAWALAFILYKPAAALLYATAFRLSGGDAVDAGTGLPTGPDAIEDVIVGLSLMAAACLALPALLALLTPMVSSLSGGDVVRGGVTAVNTGASVKSLLPALGGAGRTAGGAGPRGAARAASSSAAGGSPPPPGAGGSGGRGRGTGGPGAEGTGVPPRPPGGGSGPGGGTGARPPATARPAMAGGTAAAAPAAAAGPAGAAVAAAVSAAGQARRGTSIPGDLIRDAIGPGPRGSR